MFFRHFSFNFDFNGVKKPSIDKKSTSTFDNSYKNDIDDFFKEFFNDDISYQIKNNRIQIDSELDLPNLNTSSYNIYKKYNNIKESITDIKNKLFNLKIDCNSVASLYLNEFFYTNYDYETINSNIPYYSYYLTGMNLITNFYFAFLFQCSFIKKLYIKFNNDYFFNSIKKFFNFIKYIYNFHKFYINIDEIIFIIKLSSTNQKRVIRDPNMRIMFSSLFGINDPTDDEFKLEYGKHYHSLTDSIFKVKDLHCELR